MRLRNARIRPNFKAGEEYNYSGTNSESGVKMEAVSNIFLVLHLVGFAALFGGFLAQLGAQAKSITNGMLHGALLSLVAGVVLVGVRYPLNDRDAVAYPLYDNGKISVKLLILFVILILGYTSKKRSKDSGQGDTAAWATVGLLTFTNIVISVFW